MLGVFWRHPKRILKHFVGLVALAQIVEILLVGQTPKGIHYLRQLRSSDGRTDGVERRKKNRLLLFVSLTWLFKNNADKRVVEISRGNHR